MKYSKITVAVLLLMISNWMKAAELCVTNPTELRSALGIAESNNEHDVIKIAQGNYKASGTKFFYQEKLGWDLEISGGWKKFFDIQCGQKINDPYGTVLDGYSISAIMEIKLFGNASFSLSNITFLNGNFKHGKGGGLYVNKVDDLQTGSIIVENSVFLNNEAFIGAAMDLSGANKIIVRNNVFVANRAEFQSVSYINSDGGYGIYFTNNTVLRNTAAPNRPAGPFFAVRKPSKLLVANNVLQDNENYDLRVFGVGEYYLKNNNIGRRDGSVPIENTSNFSLPSEFESGYFNYTPSSTSPLVNAGIKPCSICQIPRPFDETWGIGSIDLAGAVRVQNRAVDIGAYESKY